MAGPGDPPLPRGAKPAAAGSKPSAARRELAIRRQLWILAGDLIGVQERLLDVAEELEGSPDARERLEDEHEVPSAADLLATIHCVLTDNINPSIDALERVCRRMSTGEGEPR
jgi:hypothetical protein